MARKNASAADGKKRAPFRERDPDQKVGPGSPPKEHQWPPGYSGNLGGRPRKKVIEMPVSQGINPLQKLAIDHAMKQVADLNGQPITRFERLMMSAEAHASENPQLYKTLIEYFDRLSREADQSTSEALRIAFEYKDKVGPIFARAEQAGKPPPPIYPHPDDVIINPDMSITIDGPKTEYEAKALHTVIVYRNVILSVVEEILDYDDAVEKKRKLYDKYRRKFYRIHRLIPRRLYIKFPKFRAEGKEYFDDDEPVDFEEGGGFEIE